MGLRHTLRPFDGLRAQRRPIGMKVSHRHLMPPPPSMGEGLGGGETFEAMTLPSNRRIDHAQRRQARQV